MTTLGQLKAWLAAAQRSPHAIHEAGRYCAPCYLEKQLRAAVEAAGGVHEDAHV